MDKQKGPLWLKPVIRYTLLSVENTGQSCPCHKQPQTYFLHILQDEHAIILGIILWAYRAVMIGKAADQQRPDVTKSL